MAAAFLCLIQNDSFRFGVLDLILEGKFLLGTGRKGDRPSDDAGNRIENPATEFSWGDSDVGIDRDRDLILDL